LNNSVGNLATDKGYLELPFFDENHRKLQSSLDIWATENLHHQEDESREAIDDACVALVKQLGSAGWLRYCIPKAFGGVYPILESRSLCLIRETLARHSGLADFAFAMQGLGSGPISLGGSAAIQEKYLTKVANGTSIAAFALSEPNAGSDVAAMTSTAKQTRDGWLINGEKTWISNGGIADFYCVFVRTSDEPGARGISAFVIDADTAGLTIADRIDVVAPHPLATLKFENCFVPSENLLGIEGQGFKLAMQTLDIFRSSVAAAALGFARRAMAEAMSYSKQRAMFGGTLADLQLTQAGIADMALSVDSSALLTYRAAWLRDTRGSSGARTTAEAAMAKLSATENAQLIVDRAVQMLGGLGVKRGHIVESLYREVRALRIYEGASEVQKVIIARELLSR
jgi:acyl-CoA dehydrogenase